MTPPGGRKALCILGSTGSIGRSAVEVVRSQPGDFRVVSLAAGRNVAELARQIDELSPELVSVADDEARSELLDILGASGGRRVPDVMAGRDGAVEAARHESVDMVLSAMVGFVGLAPTYEAALAGKDIALANKETLVAAGRLMTDALSSRGGRLLPVDSEHNAIFQCLAGEGPESIRNIWLTASGGPFFRTPESEFGSIKPADALRHPTWKMGPKVTVDSATMMNKGLEVIEAFWLFRLEPEQIRVAVHPQSVVHSMVEFVDGSIIAQMGPADMRLPIRHALNHPRRVPAPGMSLDLFRLRQLEFFPPDTGRFPCLALAYDSLREGGGAPAAMNAANEEAVAAFLREAIPFALIPGVVRETMGRACVESPTSIEHLTEIDAGARFIARDIIRRKQR